MIGISEPGKAIINMFIFALPVLGAIFLVVAIKRKLTPIETLATLLIFWGLILFAFWEMFQIPETKQYSYCWWLGGWILPLIIGVTATVIGIIIEKRKKSNQLMEMSKKAGSLKKEMPGDKKLAEVGILATIAVAIMIVGAQIAVSAPGILCVLLIGWAVVLAGIGFLIWTFVKFNKI